MNIGELSDLTELAVSNITAKRLDEIWESMSYKTKAELVNATRNYALLAHTKDEVQSKQERLLAAWMSVIYQHEQAEIMEEMK
jgi:metal-responsive CopG/Arc/MetJ family transcriptional regulator